MELRKEDMSLSQTRAFPVIEVCIGAEGEHHQPESYKVEMFKCLEFLLKKGFNPQT